MWPQFHDNCQEPRKLVRGRPWLFYFLLNWRGCMAHFANLTSVPLALPIIQRQGNIRSAFQRMANIVEGRIYVTKGPGNGESVCILKNHTAPDSSRVTREVRRALGWNDRCGKTHAELRLTFLRRLRRSFWRTLRFSTKERLQFGISERDPRAGPTTTWSWDPEEKRPAHAERPHARSCEALYRLSEGVGPGENCLRATSGQAQTPV